MIEKNKTKALAVWSIVKRNVFLLTNGILCMVVILLFTADQTRAALFLGFIALLNMVIGTAQDLHAWMKLEQLQALTAPRVRRLNADGSTTSVLNDQILVGDIIALNTGDQVPCDSVLIDTLSIEVNESLITGESHSLPRTLGDTLFAGSIITAGSGSVRVSTSFQESRIAHMTTGLKSYSLNTSPIQHAANAVIRYAGYALILSIVYIVAQGIIVNDSIVHIVLTVGTLASMLVPQGLVFTVTIFFAYGAANLFQKQVLLQEINATEKLGRIKNLCMDKTGTLTENALTVEAVHVPEGIDQNEALAFMHTYIEGTRDKSQTMQAIQKHIDGVRGHTPLEITPFSAWRGYGAVRTTIASLSTVIFVGSSEAFLPHLPIDHPSTQWLNTLLSTHAQAGKHVLCVMRATHNTIPQNLETTKLSVVAVVIFHNHMREGIDTTVRFFQDRGVRIRILTGDNPDTARAIAERAGILDTQRVITGAEMHTWSTADFVERVSAYTIFARIVPEQKEKIIEAFKKNGFTAMIGDGANDALAIKKADLGIAMFDGAPATRQLASIVLMNNSFSALPRGVELADDIIRNIEIFSSIFLNQTITGFFLFIVLSVLGYDYPLTPFNITFINYFTIGLPGILISYWTVRPRGKVSAVGTQPFLQRVLPFAICSAIIQTLCILGVYILNDRVFRITPPNTLISVVFIIVCYMFFLCAPTVFHSKLSRVRKIQTAVATVCGAVLLYIALQIPLARLFFTIQSFSLNTLSIAQVLLLIFMSCGLQLLLAKHFKQRRQTYTTS